MYQWRKLTEEQRKDALRERKGRGLPWHSPPHLDFAGPVTFIITAACFEHTGIIGKTPDRMADCEQRLIEACEKVEAQVFAWCILPNHYHLLVRTDKIKELRREIGYFHGLTARIWNIEDDAAGRQVWFNFFDRDMKSERHYWASLNYVHHNAVHHGYAGRWQDWPYSSAGRFLEDAGRENAARIWNEYPILDYGKDWDVY